MISQLKHLAAQLFTSGLDLSHPDVLFHAKTEDAKRRVMAMGEPEGKIHVVGSPELDFHAGDSGVSVQAGLSPDSDAYRDTMEEAHVLPLYPESWNYPSSATPERTYTLLNRESREFTRFINPSDYRVADDACGA